MKKSNKCGFEFKRIDDEIFLFVYQKLEVSDIEVNSTSLLNKPEV